LTKCNKIAIQPISAAGSPRRFYYRLRVFENSVLRRIFGPKRDEETGGWRKLHNEELHDLHSSPRIGRVIKARRTKWAEYVARIGEVRGA
jgi:hypothetical protein